MRSTLIATAATALAAGAMLAGAGTAVAADCVYVVQQDGQSRCVSFDPAQGAPQGGIGYGSFGTGSLADLFSQIVLTGSNALSLQAPIGTGSYAPGSTGSYGPEASVGELSVASVGTLAQGSIGS